jgi:hypothetical protein
VKGLILECVKGRITARELCLVFSTRKKIGGFHGGKGALPLLAK